MTLPALTVRVGDGNLGLTAPAPRSHIKIGTCSAGSTNTVFGFSDATQLVAARGTGPLVEAMAHTLAHAGGPSYGVRVSASNVGTNGTVMRTGTGPTPGATVTGNPLDDYDAIVQIVRGGAVGTATFKISFDGGDNYSLEYATAATVTSFAAATGLTIAFAVGTYIAGDLYSWRSTGPTYSASDLAAALDAIKTNPVSTRLVHVVGTVGGADDAAKVTNFVSLCAAINTKLGEMFNAGRYVRCLVEAPDVADAAYAVAAVQNFVAPRIIPAAGYAEVKSALTARDDKRHAAWLVAEQMQRLRLNQSPGWVGAGPLPGLSVNGAGVTLYRDEFATPGLDDLRFTTLRSFGVGSGYFVTQGRTFAAPGSDYQLTAYAFLIDYACEIARAALLPYINADLETNDAGFIAEREAVSIEQEVNGRMASAIVAPRYASGAQVQLSRTTNLQSAQTLPVRVRVRPRPITPWIDLDIGLSNPLLEAAA